MPFSAIAFRLLFSAPSDISDDDLRIASDAVSRWNVIYGEQAGAVVLPRHWGSHSVAHFGRPPQDEINDQLVESVDIVVAMFWHRLGSPTENAESGTVEEIARAMEGGAYVAVLQCSRAFPTDVDTMQLDRLREFLRGIQDRALILGYDDAHGLASHVDAVLSRATALREGRTAAEQAGPVSAAEIWPRVESRDRVETDSRGRTGTRTSYSLVLTNVGQRAARNVRHAIESKTPGERPFSELENEDIEVLPPGGDAHFPLRVALGHSRSARCRIWWEDDTGEHENFATVRLP